MPDMFDSWNIVTGLGDILRFGQLLKLNYPFLFGQMSVIFGVTASLKLNSI